jgi:hypothetical protein
MQILYIYTVLVIPSVTARTHMLRMALLEQRRQTLIGSRTRSRVNPYTKGKGTESTERG